MDGGAKWLNRITALVLMAFSLLILTSSLTVGVGSFDAPGPGFTGFLASLFLFFLSTITFIKDIKRHPNDNGKTPPLNWETLKKPLIVAGTLCCYTAVLGTAGYLVATTFLMFVMLTVYHPRRWFINLVTAAVSVVFSYLLFYKWLGVQLPLGTLGLGW